jgi:hypothetical protein
MNRIVLTGLALAVMLSACGGCPPYVPRVVGCYDVTDLKLPPMALRYQKQGQFGRTDYNQRKEDMIECGIPRERYEDNLYYIRGGPPSETTEQFFARGKKFSQCMKAKGYLQLGLE